MSDLTELVVFRLDDQRFALPLAAVERIVRAVEVTALPGAPEVVTGVIDVEGSVLPVVDLRRRFGLPLREMSASDQFLIVHTSRRTVVLATDEVQGLVERVTAELVRPAEIVAEIDQIEGVVRLDDGLALIHNLECALSLDEERALDEALLAEAVHAN